ncbi:MAG: TIM barrel protein, partial [Moorellales bacterium]
FGPAGASPLFYAQGGKSSTEVPAWLHRLGLGAFEYQCGRGINVKEETARAIGREAARFGVALTLHGPYYINLAAEGSTRENTRRHLRRSIEVAAWMGATKVVFHPGAAGNDRGRALRQALGLLEEVLEETDRPELRAVRLAPETTGKVNQLGTLEEVLALCRLDPRIVPTLDFAHLYARDGGRPADTEDFRRLLEAVAEALGEKALRDLHIHFSPIEFTRGGERRHGNLLEEGLGPDFEALAQALASLRAEGTVICESADRQAEDALIYQKIWRRIAEGG